MFERRVATEHKAPSSFEVAYVEEYTAFCLQCVGIILQVSYCRVHAMRV